MKLIDIAEKKVKLSKEEIVKNKQLVKEHNSKLRIKEKEQQKIKKIENKKLKMLWIVVISLLAEKFNP